MNVKIVKSSLLMCLVALSITATAQAADYTWDGTKPSNSDWNVPVNWGAADYPRLAGDTATFNQDFTGAYAVDLMANVTINSLSVTDSATATKFAVTINNGSGTPTLTLNGATPTITSALDGGQAININPSFNFNTINAVLTKAGSAQVNIVNPGANFFSNLNPLGGLNVSAGTLRIQNVNVLSPLSSLKVGTGSLQLDLVNTSSFFTNQANVGGTGTRSIKNIRKVSDALSNPQVLTNNSTSLLELYVGTDSTASFLSSLAGIGSLSGKGGSINLDDLKGTNTWGGIVVNTVAGSNILMLYGVGGSSATAVVNGGSFMTGNGKLCLGDGLTLNVDSATGAFALGNGGLTLSSANSAYLYRGGQATVNWNASGKTIAGDIVLNEQGGGPATFNMLGGSLTNGSNIYLGTTSHDYDNAYSYMNISGGTLVVTNNKVFSMASVSTSKAQLYSFLTITNSGILNLSKVGSFELGRRSPASDVNATKSEATVNLDGGTLELGVPVARQNVTATTGAGSAKVQFVFNGGTLRLAKSLAQLFTNFGTANSTGDGVFVKAGGVIIDSNGFTAGISNNLVEASASLGGGLTKLGVGTIILAGTNTYTGVTQVNAGTLSLMHEKCLTTNTVVKVATDAVLNLDFIGTNTVRSLQIGDVVFARGVHGADRHPGVITGTGYLLTVEPPPSGTMIRFF